MKTSRQPIVTVLGHVDHGKTSLLDAIRNTSVFVREVGGITQSIGASVVTTKDNKKITFIDTPGHAAFSGMRKRGALVSDLVILVIDSTDGVKPQTKEALLYIKDTKIPFVVAVTKTDLPTSSVEKVLGDLEKEEIYFEGRGGQVPHVAVSAKEKKGLDNLLDVILLMSEINEVSGDPEASLESYVIETNKEKAGNSVSAVVKNGQISIGDRLFSDGSICKVRGLFDGFGRPIKQVLPGQPSKILGFETLPVVGSSIEKGVGVTKAIEVNKFERFNKTKIPIILKASTAGALEAVIALVPEEFSIVASSVGDITESDVLDARANNAVIFGFECKISQSVKKLSDVDGVRVESFGIIYKLIEELEKIIKSGLKEETGQAKIVAEFPFDGKRVAGCKITMGKINKSDKVELKRGDEVLGTIKITSIKKQKQEVSTALESEECGILFTPQLDFKTGDVLVSLRG